MIVGNSSVGSFDQILGFISTFVAFLHPGTVLQLKGQREGNATNKSDINSGVSLDKSFMSNCLIGVTAASFSSLKFSRHTYSNALG